MRIGVVIIGDNVDSMRKFALSYWNNIEQSEHEINLVSLLTRQNDGTLETLSRLQFKPTYYACRNFSDAIIYLKEKEFSDRDFCLFFDQNHRLISPGLIMRVVYFFQNNPNYHICSFPTIDTSGFYENDPRWLAPPKQLISFFNYPIAVRSFDTDTIVFLPYPPIFSYSQKNEESAVTSSFSRKREIKWLDQFGNPKEGELQ